MATYDEGVSNKEPAQQDGDSTAGPSIGLGERISKEPSHLIIFDIMPACEMKPADKKAFIGAVGKELVQRHGKRKYYKPDEVGRAAAARGYPVDVHCWAYCIFSSPEDFKALHAALGELCDYARMKAEVLSDLAGDGFQWSDLDLSWLEWPDIDLSALFDWFDGS